ncbi:MAG: hypothetical protein J7L43_00490, partial [Candidatus Aenigmarchaeota archaeon]|nr:hypothetical protein [Candidatus Aenigmarchaeota archaeon]
MLDWFKKFFKKKKEKKKTEVKLEVPTYKFASREYKLFLEEEEMLKKKDTLYEKACEFAEKIMKVQPDEKTKKKMIDAIKITKMKITPEGATSLAMLFLLSSIILTLVVVVVSNILKLGITLNHALIIILFELLFSYYLYTYPITYKRK